MLVGVTGGIGSGKSFVCSVFREMGYNVYSCDDEARRLMVTDKRIIEGIKGLIGNSAYLEDGTLNKPMISSFLFSDKSNAKAINQIVHPVVKDDFRRWVKEKANEGTESSKQILFMESAILFEAGFQDVVDKVLFVSAPLNIRIKRIVARDSISQAQAEAKIMAQMDEKEKQAMSDYVIVNDEKHDLRAEIDDVISRILML